MADAENADTGLSEENFMGDDAELVDADDKGGVAEVEASTEELATLEEPVIEDVQEEKSGDSFSAAEQAFLQDIEGKTDESPTEEDELDEVETKGASPRLQKRLRDVISQRNETRQAVEQYKQWGDQARQQYSTLTQQAQGVLTENQQLKQQMASLSAEVKTLKEYGLQQRAPDQPEDYATQFQRETLEQAQKQVVESMDPQIQQLKNQIASMEQADQKRQSDAMSQASRQRIIQATETAVGQHLFPEGFPQDIMDKKVGAVPVGNMLSNLVLAHSYGANLPVAEATKQLAEAFRYYGLGWLRAQSARSGNKIAKSQKTTSLASRGGAGKGKSHISQKQAIQKGYKDSLEAAMGITGLIGEE